MDQTPFEQACVKAGGLVALARSIGKPKQTVNHYKTRVPEDACPLIERATGVRCEELRSDIRWVRVPHADWPSGKPLIDATPDAITSSTEEGEHAQAAARELHSQAEADLVLTAARVVLRDGPSSEREGH